MKKRIFLIVLTGLLLCSCGTGLQSEPDAQESGTEAVQEMQETSAAEADETVTETEAVQETAPDADSADTDAQPAEPIENEHISYKLFADAVKAEDIYDVRDITLPDSINGMSYFPCGIAGDQILVVLQKDLTAEDYPCEYGTLDCNTLEYTQLIPDIKNSFADCFDGRYFVFCSNKSDQTMFLQLYDTETNTFKTIMNFVENYQPSTNHALLCNGKVYFDGYITADHQKMAVFEYDIESDTLKTVAENAHSPMVSGDTLWYVNYNPETQTADKVVNNTDGSEMPLKDKNLNGIYCADNRFFAFTSDESVDPHYSSFNIVELRPDTQNRAIISTTPGEGEIFDTMISNDFCLAWGDNTSSESTPCVYDTERDAVVYFESIGKCYYTSYLNSGKGLLFDNMNFNATHKVCVFCPKEN